MRVVEGVRAVTNKGLPYADFIARIAEEPGPHGLAAILVKIADLDDNSDLERLARLDEAIRVRLLAKYEPAKAVLRAAAEARGWKGEGL